MSYEIYPVMFRGRSANRDGGAKKGQLFRTGGRLEHDCKWWGQNPSKKIRPSQPVIQQAVSLGAILALKVGLMRISP